MGLYCSPWHVKEEEGLGGFGGHPVHSWPRLFGGWSVSSSRLFASLGGRLKNQPISMPPMTARPAKCTASIALFVWL